MRVLIEIQSYLQRVILILNSIVGGNENVVN